MSDLSHVQFKLLRGIWDSTQEKHLTHVLIVNVLFLTAKVSRGILWHTQERGLSAVLNVVTLAFVLNSWRAIWDNIWEMKHSVILNPIYKIALWYILTNVIFYDQHGKIKLHRSDVRVYYDSVKPQNENGWNCIVSAVQLILFCCCWGL